MAMESSKVPEIFSVMLSQRMVPLRHIDNRSDEEIAQALHLPGPVTSQRNVRAFWGTGFQTMRKWNQRNVINWVRMLGPEWTVHVLDTVEGSRQTSGTFYKFLVYLRAWSMVL